MKKSQNLAALIEEAIIDAYGEDEQRMGFLVMIEENIPVPFSATIAGSSIQVKKFDVDDHRIFVRCKRNGRMYSVDVLDIVPEIGTPGVEWIAAYRQWQQYAR